MIKLSESTLSKITNDNTQAKYIYSRAFATKSAIRKTSKRTRLTTDEISKIINPNKGKSHLRSFVSFERFKKQGDIRESLYEKIIQSMTCIQSKE